MVIFVPPLAIPTVPKDNVYVPVPVVAVLLPPDKGALVLIVIEVTPEDLT